MRRGRRGQGKEKKNRGERRVGRGMERGIEEKVSVERKGGGWSRKTDFLGGGGGWRDLEKKHKFRKAGRNST